MEKLGRSVFHGSKQKDVLMKCWLLGFFLNLKYVLVCIYMVTVAVTVLLCARENKPLNQTAGV